MEDVDRPAYADPPVMVDGVMYGLEDQGDRPLDPDAFRRTELYARAAEAQMYGLNDVDDFDQDPRHKPGNLLAMLPAVLWLFVLLPALVLVFGTMAFCDWILGRRPGS